VRAAGVVGALPPLFWKVFLMLPICEDNQKIRNNHV